MTPVFLESFSLHHLVPGILQVLRRLQEIRRVVIYDARGTGLSQHDVPVGPNESGLDIEAVIAATGGPAALWASFVWAPNALRLAARRPDLIERLIVFEGFARLLDVYPREAVRTLADLAEANWPLAAQTFGDISTRRAEPEAGMQFGQLYRDSVSGQNVAKIFRTFAEADDDTHEVLESIEVPTLVLHRRNDQNVPIEYGREIASAVPDARLVPLDGEVSSWATGDTEPILRAVIPFLGAEKQVPSHGALAAPPVRAVLFTDLVGHTEMMSRLGDDRGRAVLREHERITREVLKTHGGTEIKTMGDGFMASFSSVARAVECAIALQRAFAAREGEPLSVRVGLNAGEPIEEDGDLFGATVILASRIAAKAEGGEILVADTVRGLCSGKGYLFSDRGEFVAKGFEDPVRVYEVRWRNG
jgi:class 3 adenylate cyclase